MTKAKKLVALLLAFLMIFSSVSVLASADDATATNGTALNIGTKFFKEVDGEWVETEKVRPGDVVEARVYLGTDYYSSTSTLLFFYDNDFFTHAYGAGYQAIEFNPDFAFVTSSGADGSFVADSSLISTGNTGASADFLASHGSFTVQLELPGISNVKYDNSDWFFKFTLTVADGASGEGDLFVEESSIQNTSNSDVIIDVPRGEADSDPAENEPMWLWDANVTLTSQPVSTISSVTFKANEGTFADATTEAVVEGEIDSDIAADKVPVATRNGYTFKGWIDAADTTPTLEEVVAAPTQIPENDLVLNAFWVKNVNITFADTGDAEIPAINDVTPGDAFAAVTEPTKAGYTFVGWDVRGGELPEVYPDVDTTYTAIWAVNVTVSFDTKDGTEIPPVDGYEGQTFDANAIAKPEKEGYYFIGWAPAGTYNIVNLPDVFPGEDTTYDAVYEKNVYTVEYYLDGSLATALRIQYGDPITIPYIPVAEGVSIDGWYTDSNYQTAFVEGTEMGTEVVKLYARTGVESYYAIFMDGDKEHDRKLTRFGDMIELPADPSKTGYTFAGWSPVVAEMDTEADKIFTATWAVNEYSITYELNYEGAGTYAVFGEIPYGSDYEVPAEPEREGYTFEGWGATSDATQAAELPEKMGTDNATYYAIWTVNKYTIDFDSDGGTPVDSITEDYGTALTAPAAPTKTGYTFNGWAPEFPATMPAENMTLVAQWKINQYKITFETVGGTEIDPVEGDFGAPVTPPSNPEKTGYTFTGWDKEIPQTIPAENITITAQWEINTYNVTFDSNGGSDVEGYTDVEYDSTITEPTAPTKTGYTFAGWYYNDAKVDFATFKIPADDVTLVADWAIESHTIAFETNGASNTVDDITAEYDADITAQLPKNEDMAKEGHVFAGWSETDGGAIVALPTTMPDLGDNGASKTYYAVWTKESHTIAFDVNGGETAVGSITAEYAEDITAKLPADADMKKTGYTFIGWSEVKDGEKVDLPTAMPDLGDNNSTKTYYAIWEVNEYTLSFDTDGAENTVEDITADYGTDISGKLPKDEDMVKTGYTFKGWDITLPTVMGATDVEAKAIWEINKYNSVFKLDGGNIDGATADVPVETVYNETIKAPDSPSKTGFVFSGWSLNGVNIGTTMPKQVADNNNVFTAVWSNADDTPYYYEIYVMDTNGDYAQEGETIKLTGETNSPVSHPAAGDRTGFAIDAAQSVLDGTIDAEGTLVLKVYYERQTFTVSFETAGGTDVADIERYYEGKITAAETETTKTGYDFAGWVDGEGNAVDLATFTIPAEDVALTATWTPKADTKYTVVVNYTDYTGVAHSTTVEYSGTTENAIEIVEAAGSAEKTEYVLFSELQAKIGSASAHYHLDTTAANVLTGTVAAEGTAQLSVYFVVNNYTVNYYTEPTMAEDELHATGEYTYMATLIQDTIPATAPTKEGYTFAGWKDAEGNAPSGRLQSNKDYIAQWTKESYTITFATNGAENTVANITDEYGADITAKLPKDADMVKEGYIFAGWSETEDGAIVALPTEMPDLGDDDAAKTYYAVWTVESYTINLINGVTGETIATITKNFGEAIDAVEAPAVAGYTFSNWSEPVPTVMPDLGDTGASKDITAEYTINTYSIVLKNGVTGATIQTITKQYNEAIGDVADPAQTGYKFVEWSEEIPEFMPALGENNASKEITAIFEIESYTIAFETDGAENTVNNITDVYAADISAKLPVAADMVKEGYIFAGWSETEGGAIVALPTEMPDLGDGENVVKTYYAVWTIESYTINLINGVTGATIATITKNFGEAIDAVEAPAVEGYTFSKWSETVPTVMPDLGNTGASKDITAEYTPNDYTITFVTNGAENTVENIEAAYKSDITSQLPKDADMVKEGYKFGGWAASADSEEAVVLPTTMPLNGATYYALWVANGYTVTFDADGGDAVAQQTVTYGEKIKEVTTKKEGYIFAGWYYNDTKVDFATFTMPAEDITLKADWTVENYTINLINGVTGETITTITKNFGEAIDAVEAPAVAGYTFSKWSEPVPPTMPDLGDTGASKDITAEYTINTYSIVLVNGVTGATIQTITKNFNEAIGEVADPTEDGYDFVNWSEPIPEKMPALGDNNASKTITANFTPKTYTITFVTNGAENTVENIEAAYTSNITDKLPADSDMVKEGYAFGGWAATADSTEKVDLPATMPLNGATYYAIWVIQGYTITFDTVGGSEVKPQTVTYGEKTTSPDSTKEGHELEGWYYNGVKVDFETFTMPAEDITFIANWTALPYNINYMTNTGLYEKVEVIYGTPKAEWAKPANDPTRTGYKFDVWDYDAVDYETMPAKEINVSAKWDKESYTIAFETKGAENTVNNITAEYGANIAAQLPVSSAMVKTGYVFEGWSETDGGAIVTLPTTMGDLGDGDNVVKTYYAVWAIESYTITVVNGVTGETIATIAQEFNTPIDAIEAPAVPGYTFSNWSEPVPPAMPDLGADGASKTITAEYTINTYSIVLKNGVNGETIQTITKNFDEAIGTVADPVFDGYKFTGWSEPIPEKMPALGENNASKEIVANFEIRQFTITFENTGDSTIAPITQDYGTAVEAPADPEKYGYNFNGWDVEIPEKMPAEDTVVTATWAPKTIAVTFNANGGTFADGEETTKDSTFDEAIKLPDAPSRDGYGFKGWATSADATEGSSDLGTLITETPATYYAVWEAGATEYTIEIYEQDLEGNYNLVDSKKDSGSTDTLATYEPTEKTGFKVADDSKLSGTITADGKLVLTVKYERQTYKLSYTVDGVSVQEYDVLYGTKAEDMPVAADPNKEGYTFTGWTAAPATMPATEVSIASNWAIESYSIILVNSVNNETIQTITQNYATTIGTVADPVFDGYKFTGWSEPIPGQMPDLGNNGATKTIVANFDILQFTVTFDTDGGSDVEAITQDFGTKLTATDIPTKEGHEFDGWLPKVPETMPAENITVKAQWITESYTIDFVSDGENAVNDITAKYGTDISAYLPKDEDMVKTGYKFAGWEDAEGKSVTLSNTMGDMGDNNATVTYKAKWDIQQFTITLVNGVTGATIATITQDYDSVIDAVDNPAMTGYSFTGWSEPIPGKMPAKDMTITANFTADGHVITLVNGVTGKTIDVISLPFGTAIGKVEDPVMEGYKFTGWDATIPETMPAEDMTITANFDVLSFEITWNSENKTETLTYEYGSVIEAPKAADKAGYYFVTWGDVPKTMPAENLEFTALYEVSVYRIYYVVDGVNVGAYSREYGSVIPTTVSTYTVPEGHTFYGWYTDAAFQNAFVEGTTLGTENVTLYAYTEVAEFDAIFKLNGGNINGSTEDVVVKTAFGAEIEAPADPVKEGYVFKGWSPVVAEMDEEGKTFTAIWAKNDALTITYKDDDGSVLAVFDNMTYGGEMEIPIDPDKVGYTFTGWVDAEGKSPADYATMPATNLEFKATYTVNTYKVTFKLDGGNIGGATEDIVDDAVAYGASIEAPAAPAKEGFTFAAWVDAEGDKVDFATYTMPANDVIFTATYTQNAPTTVVVTYMQYAASEHGPYEGSDLGYADYTTQTYNIGEELALADAPAAVWTEHYDFLGWFDADGTQYLGGEAVNAELTLYPKYERHVIKLLPKEGTTIVIERNGATESYNDNSVTSDYPYTGTDYAKYYIYGFGTGRLMPTTQALLERNSVVIQGDGYLKVTMREGQTRLGTGALVELYDAKDDTLVESFYIVVFGDLDGNGTAHNVQDTNEMTKELDSRSWSNTRNPATLKWHMIKAANLDGSVNSITIIDKNRLASAYAGTYTISQITGLATPKA